MAKARVGLYITKGDTLTRTHKSCPKCGPGTFLAEHPNRRSCGKCGYSESKAPSSAPPVPGGGAPKGKGPAGQGKPKGASPPAGAKPAAPAPPKAA